jgi:FlaA1/EpsC-like NDP-sugar epimerase
MTATKTQPEEPTPQDMFEKAGRLKNFKQIMALSHDALVACFSIPFAAGLTFGFSEIALKEVTLISLAFCFFSMIFFRIGGMYRGIWRYASIGDLINLVRAATLGVILFAPSTIYLVHERGVSYTLPIIHWMVLILALGGPRLIYRAWKDGFMLSKPGLHNSDQNKMNSNILLVGAGDSAELFIRSLAQNRVQGYRVVGIVDYRDDRLGREMHGVKVLGMLSDLDNVMKLLGDADMKPQRIIFTDEISAMQRKMQTNEISLDELTSQLDQYGLKISRLPSMTEFKDGLAEGQGAIQLRPIAIEDLLGRPQANIDMDAIRDFVRGKSVLITGSGGTIGSELARQIASFSPSQLIMLDNGEFNLYSIDYDIRDKYPTLMAYSYVACVRDEFALKRIFATHKPQLVFHAAALKHVPLVELNPCEGVLTNVIGTRNVAKCARDYNAMAFVQISTDKAVNPTNVMGATKRLGEYYAQALELIGCDSEKLSTRFMTVRFGNVLGSSGSVVPLFRKQLEAGGPLTVTHPDIKRFFMTVKEAVSLVLQSAAHGMSTNGDRGRIFVLDMGEPMKIVDVARQMIRLANLAPDSDIKVVFTGLRPGEKLYEELFDRNEKPVSTDSPGVMAAIPQPIEQSLLARTIENLELLAREGDEQAIIQKLASIVPGYDEDFYDDQSTLAKNMKGLKERMDEENKDTSKNDKATKTKKG